jgi:hypothetical protein
MIRIRSLVPLALAGVLLAAPASSQVQFVRNSQSNPPNPLAYGLDPLGGPRVGGVWNPTVSNAPGLFVPPPSLATFFIAISTGPSVPEIFLGTTAGTVLVDLVPPNPLLLVGPIAGTSSPVPASIPIPSDCSLAGLLLSSQAAIVDTVTGIRLANAIDFQIGNGPSGVYTVATWDDGRFNPDNNLRRIDTTTGATISAMPMTMPGWNVISGHGLARNPLTNELWAVVTADPTALKLGPLPPVSTKKNRKQHGSGMGGGRGATNRYLVTVCPLTAECGFVGRLGNGMSGIAFDSGGTLWGVAGDGASPSESLYIISTLDASLLPIMTLGNGTDGEMLAFNGLDGLLYHGSGYPPPGTNLILETIVPIATPPLPTNVPVVAPLDVDEANALSEYDFAAGGMWWVAGCCGPSGSILYHYVPGGVGTLIGNLDHVAHGIAVIP